MNYEDLTTEEKSKLNRIIKEKYPNSDIAINEIEISQVNDNLLKIDYRGLNIEVPIEKPKEDIDIMDTVLKLLKIFY